MAIREESLTFRKIIVGYNDSDGARDALALGKLIADITAGQLIVTGVFPFSPSERFAPLDLRARFEEAQAELAGRIQAVADELGATAEAFPSTSPARGLHDAAEELDADLVVVGSSSRATGGRVLAGNVGVQLLHGSPCAVAVAPSGFRDEPHELDVIAAAIDGSAESLGALRVAIELGKAAGATLRLVAAEGALTTDHFGWGYGVIDMRETMRAVVGEWLEKAAALVPEELNTTKAPVVGEAAAALAGEVRQGVDLLCLGSRAYGPVRRVLLGSVSSELMSSAPCPVLVVPRGVDADDAVGEAAAGEREE